MTTLTTPYKKHQLLQKTIYCLLLLPLTPSFSMLENVKHQTILEYKQHIETTEKKQYSSIINHWYTKEPLNKIWAKELTSLIAKFTFDPSSLGEKYHLILVEFNSNAVIKDRKDGFICYLRANFDMNWILKRRRAFYHIQIYTQSYTEYKTWSDRHPSDHPNISVFFSSFYHAKNKTLYESFKAETKFCRYVISPLRSPEDIEGSPYPIFSKQAYEHAEKERLKQETLKKEKLAKKQKDKAKCSMQAVLEQLKQKQDEKYRREVCIREQENNRLQTGRIVYEKRRLEREELKDKNKLSFTLKLCIAIVLLAPAIYYIIKKHKKRKRKLTHTKNTTLSTCIQTA